jgi:ComF family protein
MVGKLKYRWVREVYPVLVELVASVGEVTALERGKWRVTEVPLHVRRERWRGFNQAALLAEALAGYYGWEYHGRVLKRIQQRKPQMSLSRKERLTNVRGVFELGVGTEVIGRKRWLLVDDVWTTGATMRECGKVLKRAGAKEVWGLVLARLME